MILKCVVPIAIKKISISAQISKHETQVKELSA